MGSFLPQKGQIRLPVQAGLEVVEVDFVVVDAYSPYTAIVARPWLQTLGPFLQPYIKKLNIRQEIELRSW